MNTMTDLSKNPAALIAAYAIGLGLPMMVFGRSILQGILTVALVAVLGLLATRGDLRAPLGRVFRSPLAIMLMVTAVAWLPGVLDSPDVWHSTKSWGRTFIFIIASALIWAVLIADEGIHRRCLKTLMVTVIASGAVSVVSLTVWPELIAWLQMMPIEYSVPERDLKAFASSALCLLPVMIWAGFRLGGGWRSLGYIAAVLCFAVIVLAESRSAIAGILVAAAALAVVFAVRYPRRLPMFAGGAAVITAGIFLWVWDLEKDFTNVTDVKLPIWLIDQHRQIIWQFTFEKFLETPWFGHGVDTINMLPEAKALIPKLGSEYIPSHPHNWFLEALSETGIIGMLPLMVCFSVLFTGLTNGIVAGPERDRKVALVALSCVFWVSSLFNFSIWSTWWLLTYFLLFALISAAPAGQTDTTRQAD